MKIFIIGMHRSGTSMVAGLLQRCGLHLGDNLLMGLKDNPSGHFEDKEFLALNKRILRESGGSWKEPPKTVAVPGRTVEAMRTFIDKWPRDRLVGWKDPRSCLTLPIWINAMWPEDMRIVFVLRPFNEVAESLRKRNGFSVKYSSWLVSQYIRQAILNLRGTDYILTGYHSYFNNWKGELGKVCKFLGLCVPSDAQEIEGFIDRRLWHCRGGNG